MPAIDGARVTEFVATPFGDDASRARTSAFLRGLPV
jgi:hypothetical protein